MSRQLPARNNYVKSESKMAENPENQDILNDTTEEIVLGTSENENASETNEIVGPVQVHEPVIQIIDLVSETGSEKPEMMIGRKF
jgi:hypothetical protein